jgi:imidazolonepropionase-like amidohydrolase
MRRHIAAAVTTVAATICAAAFGLGQTPAHGFRISNVHVFDGQALLQNSGVAVERGVIRAVGRELTQWQHLPLVDGGGGTLLPGFIDAHVHVRDARELRQALRFGATTTLDLGAIVEPDVLFALRSASETSSDMAELRVAGYAAIARRPDEPAPRLLVSSTPRLMTTEDVRQFFSGRRAERVNHIKMIMRGAGSATGAPNLTVEMIRTLVEAARSLDIAAVAHVETLDDVRRALAGGVDALVHVWRTEGANADMAREIAAAGTAVMPIAVGPDSFLPSSRAALLEDPRFRHLLSTDVRAHLDPARSFPLIPITSAPIEERRASFELQLAATRSLHEAGVKFIAGSDASSITPVAFGISLHREFELLNQSGLSPSEILTASTAGPAELFRLRDRGRVAVGLRADLVLVRRNPTQDILATRDIQKVWKAGAVVNMNQ